MAMYRVLWHAGDGGSGYYDEIDRPTVAEAVWAIATARTAGGTAGSGQLPVLVDVQPIPDLPQG